MSRRGFTLIELLVVISIIGLLSSVITASLNSAREKGRLAAGKQFDANVFHAAGDQAVGIWDFDECSGSTSTIDRSGYGNHGTLLNTSGWPTDTPSNTGCALSFNGSNSSVRISSLASMQSPDITYSAWVYPTDVSSYRTIVAKEGQYKYRIQNGALFAFADCDGSIPWSATMAGSSIVSNKWQHTAFVVDSASQTITLYLDGELAGTSSLSCSITGYNSSVISIGTYNAVSAEPFVGNIDAVRIYTKSLTASEVGRLYAESAPKYRFADTR